MRSIITPVLVTSALAVIVACGSSSRDGGFGSSGGEPDPSNPGASSGSPPPGSLGTSGGSSGQSSGGSTCAADSVKATRAEVDIIIVIDTSGSMDEETSQVKSNINTFASKIGGSGLDYNVVLLAEKPQSIPFPFPGIPAPGICVPPPLGGADCKDNPPKYHQINEAVGSTDSLQIILDKYSAYQGYLRPTAYKVFIEVTDDNSALGWQAFDQQLLAKSSAMFGDSTKRKYIFNSICGWKKNTAKLSGEKCGTAVNTGDQYQQLSNLTNGIVDSVCESDYSGVFDNIAKGLVTKLGCEFNFPKGTTGKDTDPQAVVVSFTPGGGTASPLTQVTDASKCGTVKDAWYYDNNNAPTKIIFCPSTCQAAGADTNGKIDILVGCKAPPPK
jgi:hypothetical protein